jgi:SAM-dependent methyltransferase
MFKSFIALVLCSFASLFARNEDSFQIIDLGNLSAKQQNYLDCADLHSYKTNNHTEFNGAPDMGKLVQILKSEFQIDVAIETGTFLAGTTHFLSASFDEVHTIEVLNEHYDFAKESLKFCQNVHCYLGSSEKILHEILPILMNKKIFFYLDAHWGSYWPLLDELEEISKTHRDRCIIMIDDFKVPGRPDIGFDSYSGGECSYPYIREKLSRIFSSYDYYYVIPVRPENRAKFLAIPKSWPKNPETVCETLRAD